MTVIQKIKLFVTTECNMKCEYCMIKNSHDFMNFEVAKKSIDKYIFWTDSIWRNKFIYFFGGEPLLNFKLIKQCIEYVNQEKHKYDFHIRFVICTNFTVVSEEILNFIIREGVFLSISIWWVPEIHNSHRVFDNRSIKSFDIIQRNINNLQNKWYNLFKIWSGLVILNKYISDFYKYFMFIITHLHMRHINIEIIVDKIAWNKHHFSVFKQEYNKIIRYVLESIETWDFVFLNNLNWKILEKQLHHTKDDSSFSYFTEVHPAWNILFSWFYTHLPDSEKEKVTIENVLNSGHTNKVSEEFFQKSDNYFDYMELLSDFQSNWYYPLLKKYMNRLDERIAEIIIKKSIHNDNYKKYISQIFDIYF